MLSNREAPLIDAQRKMLRVCSAGARGRVETIFIVHLEKPSEK